MGDGCNVLGLTTDIREKWLISTRCIIRAKEVNPPSLSLIYGSVHSRKIVATSSSSLVSFCARSHSRRFRPRAVIWKCNLPATSQPPLTSPMSSRWAIYVYARRTGGFRLCAQWWERPTKFCFPKFPARTFSFYCTIRFCVSFLRILKFICSRFFCDKSNFFHGQNSSVGKDVLAIIRKRIFLNIRPGGQGELAEL